MTAPAPICRFPMPEVDAFWCAETSPRRVFENDREPLAEERRAQSESHLNFRSAASVAVANPAGQRHTRVSDAFSIWLLKFAEHIRCCKRHRVLSLFEAGTDPRRFRRSEEPSPANVTLNTAARSLSADPWVRLVLRGITNAATNLETKIMGSYGMGFGFGSIWMIILLVLVGLMIAALIKYLRS